MSEFSTADNSDEQILASFIAAYEAAADKPAVLKDYCHRYPLLASEFEALDTEHRAAQMSGVFYESAFSAVAELMGSVTMAAIVWAGGRRLAGGAVR